MATRAFIGLWLPGPVASGLAQLGREQADQLGASARAVPGERLHLTLAFLGSRSDEELAEAAQQLEQVFAHERAFRLAWDGVIRLARGSVWAARVAGPDAERLRAARARLVEPLVRADLLSGEHPAWRPHVTFLRSRGRAKLPAAPSLDLPAEPWMASAAALIASRPQGSEHTYTELVRVELEPAH